ncbi:ZN414 protein, partial [Alectura lathami]|nr:ZN414 protein [Alectura lathami]
RPAQLSGSAAARLASPPPLPAAGTQPFRALILDSVLRAAPHLGAVPVLRAPSALCPTRGPAPPAAPRTQPQPARFHRRLEEKPRCECHPTPPMLWLRSDHSSNSRIVWEHTRGRYTCMQCPYSTASREEMTLHIEEHRKNPPLPGRVVADVGFGVDLASFHSKLTPEMENSLYSQL